MTLMPFLCLGFGGIIGVSNIHDKVDKYIDTLINGALIMLMLVIGIGIGSNKEVISNLHSIGFNCVVIALVAMFFSVLCTLIVEKRLISLEKVRVDIMDSDMDVESKGENTESEDKFILWAIPISVIAGVLIGYCLFPRQYLGSLDRFLTIALVILYISVGISIGSNKRVLKYIKILGYRVIFISMGIIFGSIIGGIISSRLLGLETHVGLLSSVGMSYYSITGAYMSKTYGIAIGTYGFMVNVLREFFTVLMLPVAAKISLSSPIACGAAGNMDTMLVPVTKVIGEDLGLVTLVTGIILTICVPILLPIINILL